MAMKYEDLSPRTREQADAMDKDDVEWNKAIKETLEDLIKMELEEGVPFSLQKMKFMFFEVF